MTKQSQYRAAQDPLIGRHSTGEMIGQTIIVGAVVALSYWLFGFEISLLALLVSAFGLTTMNVIAGAVSTNVQVAEVRDELKKLNDYLMQHQRDI